MKKLLVLFIVMTSLISFYYISNEKIDKSYKKNIFHKVDIGFNIRYLGEV